MVWGGSIAVLLSIALGVPAPDITPPLSLASTRAGSTTDEQARSVGRMVGGIIGYARWPGPQNSISICTMGTTRLAQRLNEAGTVAPIPVTVRDIPTGSAAAAQGCDVLYLGVMPAAQQQRAIMAVHGQPVLSVAEADPTCRSGAMFCLVSGAGTLTFRINVDAVSRGTVRIDARVLRMFAGGGAS